MVMGLTQPKRIAAVALAVGALASGAGVPTDQGPVGPRPDTPEASTGRPGDGASGPPDQRVRDWVRDELELLEARLVAKRGELREAKAQAELAIAELARSRRLHPPRGVFVDLRRSSRRRQRSRSQRRQATREAEVKEAELR